MRVVAAVLLLAAVAAAAPEPAAAEYSRKAVEAAVPLLDDPEHGDAAFRVVTGAWDREHAVEVLLSGLADPDVVVGHNYLWALCRLSPAIRGEPYAVGIPMDPRWLPPDFQRFLPALVEALPRKRGPALAAAFDLVLRDKLPLEMAREAARRAWPDLTNEYRAILLEFEWERIGSPELRPFLEPLLDLEPRVTQWHVADLRSLAVQRLVEMGSERAREIVLADLRRKKPFLADCALTALPDEAVPDLDAHFAEVLYDGRDADQFKVAPLIERYASEGLVDLVVETVRQHRWACSIQEALLGYVLKHDRARALAEVRFAAGRRGKEETGCYRSVLRYVLAKDWGPDAEALAFEFLGDPEEAVRRNVADLLFEHGSPAGATPLLDRLTAPDATQQERDSLLGRFLMQDRWELTKAERDRLWSQLDTETARLQFGERYR